MRSEDGDALIEEALGRWWAVDDEGLDLDEYCEKYWDIAEQELMDAEDEGKMRYFRHE